MKQPPALHMPLFQTQLRLISPLSQEDVVSALRAVTDPKPNYTLFDPYLGDFRGKVTESDLDVRWWSYGMWRFKGITKVVLFIAGEIRPTPEGCVIDLAIRRNLALFWIPVAILLAIATGCIADAVAGRHQDANFGLLIFVPALAFMVTWMFGVINFYVVIGELKTRFSQLWRTRTVEGLVDSRTD